MRKLPLFVLLGWSALIIKYPLIDSLSSLSRIVESKNVPGKHMISMLFALINASIKGTLTKSWAAIPLRFQWQKFSLEDFIGPGLISISPDPNNSKWWLECSELKSSSFGNFKRKNSLIIKKEIERTVR